MVCLFYFFKIFSILGYFIFLFFYFYFIKNYGKGKKGLLSAKIGYFISYESLFCHKEEPDADLLDKGIESELLPKIKWHKVPLSFRSDKSD